MSRAARFAAYLWAAPATVVGLLLSIFFAERSVAGGLLLCEGASWPRRLGWKYRAITLGHVVLCVDELDAPTLAHERVHVAQYERWGAVLFLAYPLASVTALAKGLDPYRDNRFEKQARALAEP